MCFVAAACQFSATNNNNEICSTNSKTNTTKEAENLISFIDHYVELTHIIDKFAKLPEFKKLVEDFENIKKEVNDAIVNKEEESINLQKIYEIKTRLANIYKKNS